MAIAGRCATDQLSSKQMFRTFETGRQRPQRLGPLLCRGDP